MKKSSAIIFLLIFLFASCNLQAEDDIQVLAESYAETIAVTPETTIEEEVTSVIETSLENITNITEETTQEVTTLENITEETAQKVITQEITTESVTTIKPAAETTTELLTTAATTESPEIIEPVIIQPRNIPVFMYHTSSEDNPGRLADFYVKPSEFEKQIKYLTENGYIFCTFDDWDNLHNIDKPVFITFDDGYESNYTEIFPILQKYKTKITLFLTISNMEAENFTAEMIREMNDSGLVKFESHTMSHSDLTALSSDEITSELADSKKQIEKLTGKPVLAVAYPFGGYNVRVIERAREYYKFGLTVIHGIYNTGWHDNFEIRRFTVSRVTSIGAFINMLN